MLLYFLIREFQMLMMLLQTSPSVLEQLGGGTALNNGMRTGVIFPRAFPRARLVLPARLILASFRLNYAIKLFLWLYNSYSSNTL